MKQLGAGQASVSLHAVSQGLSVWFLHGEQVGLPHSMAALHSQTAYRVTKASRARAAEDNVAAVFDDLALEVAWCSFRYTL